MTILSDASEFGFHHSGCKMSSFNSIMGDAAWLAWIQKTCMKNTRYTKCEHPGTCYFLASFIFLRKTACHWQRCKFAIFGDCAEVYLWRHRPMAWPELKMKKLIMSRLGISRAKFRLSIANGSGAIARKPSGEGGGVVLFAWRRISSSKSDSLRPMISFNRNRNDE